VDEEVGQRGAQTYAIDYAAELPNHVIAMESDTGNFYPNGFGFTGTANATAIMQQILTVLLSGIGAGNLTVGGADTDNGFLGPAGVPLGTLEEWDYEPENGNPLTAYYFYFHHSNADTFAAVNPVGMANSVAAYAVLSYVLADMPTRLPFGNGTATSPPVQL